MAPLSNEMTLSIYTLPRNLTEQLSPTFGTDDDDALKFRPDDGSVRNDAATLYTFRLLRNCIEREERRWQCLKEIQVAPKLQRCGRRFLAVRRWQRKRNATVSLQRTVRGFLQRLKGAQCGRNALSSKRDVCKEARSQDVKQFVKEHRNSADKRAALAAISSRVQNYQRAEVLDKLVELEYQRQQLLGLEAVKEFLATQRSDVVARCGYDEDINFAPLILSGPPGCGKRLSAKLIHEELTALRVCNGPFTEIQTYDELKDTWKQGNDGPVSNVVYVADMDSDDTDWNKVLKRTVKALPKAALIFGLKSDDDLRKIQAFFVKCEPVWLAIPPLSVEDLAEITRRSLEQRGYMFAGGLTTDMLVDVINEQWSSSEIGRRNGHLAEIMIRRAVQNKNKRQQLRYGAVANPTVLLPEDFGVTKLKKLELERAKTAVLQELEVMPGFAKAKTFLHGVLRRVEYVASGGNPAILETCMNLVLTGNPGSGKTTFARLLFRMLRAHGILKKDAFVEMNALELKGKYLGHTAPKVIKAVRSARGGALFLDEAYALVGDGRKDAFSDEAVHTLLTEIENHRTEVLVIIAGYKDKMGHLLAKDPGLSRRFPLRLDLPDYSTSELSQIAEKVARERFGFEFEDGLQKRLERWIEEERRNDIKTQNASMAISLVEQAVERMTCRMIEEGRGPEEGGKTLTAIDFGIRTSEEEEDEAEKERRCVQHELDSLVGMTEPKEHLRQLSKRVEFVRLGGSPKLLDTCMNLVLTGNPGTGKTTFARLLFRFLRAHGVLKKDVFIERNALELKGEYCGQTAPKIREIFDMAVGGCLFLDEAYALANGDKFSNEAIRMLLTEVENHRSEVLVVLAGYQDKMAELMRADPGLPRRFPHTLNLPDYTASDIARIAARVAEERLEIPFELGLEETLEAWLSPRMEDLNASRHNGGLAVKLTEEAMGRLADRVLEFGQSETSLKEARLTASDFGILRTSDIHAPARRSDTR